MFAAFEAHVINVTAKIENALRVNPTEITFGTVFPQEQLQRNISVVLSNSFLEQGRANRVVYEVKKKPKPRHEIETFPGNISGHEYCLNNNPLDPGNPGDPYYNFCYPNLCDRLASVLDGAIPSSEIEEAGAAFSSPTARGSGVRAESSGTTVAVTPSDNITVGKVAFFACVTDNTATANGASTNHDSVADTDTHTWTKVFEETDSDGAAEDGSTMSLWFTKVTTQIDTTDSVTLTIDTARLDGVCGLFEVTVGTGKTVTYSADTPTHSDSGTSLSETLSSLTSREYLFFGFLGTEGEDNLKTALVNYSELLDSRSSATGVADLNVMIHVATRILTGEGDTWTSSAATFTNGMQSLTAFYEVPTAVLMATTTFGVLDTQTNPEDDWHINLAVPCFKGKCDQGYDINFYGPPLDPRLEHELFGCDLWVEITGVASSSINIPSLECDSGSSSQIILEDQDLSNDDKKGILVYCTEGSEFKFAFSGNVPIANDWYALVVGEDPKNNPNTAAIINYPRSGGDTGEITVSGSVNLNRDLNNAEVWMVLGGDLVLLPHYDGYTAWDSWHPESYLFGTSLINYHDLDITP